MTVTYTLRSPRDCPSPGSRCTVLRRCRCASRAVSWRWGRATARTWAGTRAAARARAVPRRAHDHPHRRPVGALRDGRHRRSRCHACWCTRGWSHCPAGSCPLRHDRGQSAPARLATQTTPLVARASGRTRRRTPSTASTGDRAPDTRSSRSRSSTSSVPPTCGSSSTSIGPSTWASTMPRPWRPRSGSPRRSRHVPSTAAVPPVSRPTASAARCCPPTVVSASARRLRPSPRRGQRRRLDAPARGPRRRPGAPSTRDHGRGHHALARSRLGPAVVGSAQTRRGHPRVHHRSARTRRPDPAARGCPGPRRGRSRGLGTRRPRHPSRARRAGHPDPARRSIRPLGVQLVLPAASAAERVA